MLPQIEMEIEIVTACFGRDVHFELTPAAEH